MGFFLFPIPAWASTLVSTHTHTHTPGTKKHASLKRRHSCVPQGASSSGATESHLGNPGASGPFVPVYSRPVPVPRPTLRSQPTAAFLFVTLALPIPTNASGASGNVKGPKPKALFFNVFLALCKERCHWVITFQKCLLHLR